MVAGFVTVVLPAVRLPLTLVSAMPPAALFVELMLVKVAARVPVVRLSAWPVRLGESLMSTSATVRVPKLVPLMPMPVVLPTVKPRIRLLVAPLVRLMAFTALVILAIVAFPLFIAGNAALPVPGFRPVMVERLALAS